MAGVFGGTKRTYKAAELLSAMSVQTSGYGQCIPVVYGRARVAAHLIYRGGFRAYARTEVQRSGKGGGGSREYDTTYHYAADVILAICEGPVQGVEAAWVDKEYRPMSSSRMFVMHGAADQAPWPHLPEAKRVAYGSTCYAAEPGMYLGTSAALQNHSFSVLGFCAGFGVDGDASPADALQDMLTDPVHGMGFPPEAVDVGAMNDYRLYALEAGLFVSAAVETQAAAVDAVKSLLECTNSFAVWSGGKLRILPLADEPVGAWKPRATPLYALGHDDFLMDGPDGDPVEVTRKSAADAYNQVKVRYKDRVLHYSETVAEANDLAMQDRHGLRPAPDFAADWMVRAGYAQTLAQLLLQRHVCVRNEYRFRLGWRYTLLEPGDLVTLTEPGLGLDNTPVRITAVEESPDGDLTMTAEDWPVGVANAVAYPPPGGGGEWINAAAPPGDCAPPIIFEPPLDLTGGRAQTMVGTSGGPEWGGCEIHASRDGTTYAYVGRIEAPARHGALTSAMASYTGANPQTGTGANSTCRVDMAASGGTLVGATAADAAALATLSYVSSAGGGYEMLSYRTAEMTAAGRYTLGTLHRGAYSTPASAHPIGSRFMRLDGAVAAIDVDRWDVGRTIWLKFPSFNRFGRELQDISAVAAVPYTLGGPPAPAAPTAVTIAITAAAPVKPWQVAAGEAWS